MSQLSIAVDLDSTIFEYDHWRGIDHYGKVISGAKEALEQLKAEGYKIIVHTTRTNPFINKGYTIRDLVAKVEKVLKAEEIPYNLIWKGPGKPIAQYYIDDRAIKFRDWDSVLKTISLSNIRATERK